MLRGAARWIAGSIFGLFGAAMVTLLIGAGVDEQTAVGFGEMTRAFLDEATFVLLTVGGAKILGQIKAVDPAKWAENFWAKKAGEQVKDLSKPVAESKIESGQI